MYEHLNVKNVPSVLNTEMNYQVTAKFTAMLEHLNVKYVAKVTNFNLIYRGTA
jgi:hypothetical protein